MLFSLARLCDNVVWELKQPKQLFQSLKETIRRSILPPLQERTSKQSSVYSPTRWEISAVTNCKHHRRPETLQLLAVFPIRPHSAHTSPGLTAGTRIHPHAGQKEMEGGDGIQSEVSRCTVRHSTAPPLQSAALGETKRLNIRYMTTKTQECFTFWTIRFW